MINIKRSKIQLVIKIIIWLIPIIILIWVANKQFVPGGKLEVTYNVPEESKFIKNFASKEPNQYIGTKNELGNNDYTHLITVSPVYFDVYVPRAFPKATITLRYDNKDEQPLIQLGSKVSNDAYYYEDMAMYNKEIEKILNNEYEAWTWITKDDLILFQKSDKLYESIDYFLDNLPDPDKILQYNYKLANNIELPGYFPASQKSVIRKSIRGQHELFTYITRDEPLNFTFITQDINRNNGVDEIEITIFDNSDKLIDEIILPDDGEIMASGKVMPERNVGIFLNDIPAGVYRINLDTTDDVFIKEIQTQQHLIMFKDNIYLTDNEEYKDILGDKTHQSTQLFTNAKEVDFKTAHDDGWQTIIINGFPIQINESHKYFNINGLDGISEISIPKNDLLVEGDGFFFFSSENSFDPYYNLTTSLIEVEDINEYNYIIARYIPAKKSGNYSKAQAVVEVPNLSYKTVNDSTYSSFIISLPGLSESGKLFHIKQINILFEKEPITINNFFSKAKNFISK
ncbi:hypothetical protein KKC06_00265 [Patescibacteria group bacterium]|nr:hypothetical protein [Patescibacteria group bacterium]